MYKSLAGIAVAAALTVLALPAPSTASDRNHAGVQGVIDQEFSAQRYRYRRANVRRGFVGYRRPFVRRGFVGYRRPFVRRGFVGYRRPFVRRGFVGYRRPFVRRAVVVYRRPFVRRVVVVRPLPIYRTVVVVRPRPVFVVHRPFFRRAYLAPWPYYRRPFVRAGFGVW